MHEVSGSLRDIRFVLQDLLDVFSRCALLGFELDCDTPDGVLEGGSRFIGDVIAHRNSAEQYSRPEGDEGSTPDGFHGHYRQCVDNGRANMSGPIEHWNGECHRWC